MLDLGSCARRRVGSGQDVEVPLIERFATAPRHRQRKHMREIPRTSGRSRRRTHRPATAQPGGRRSSSQHRSSPGSWAARRHVQRVIIFPFAPSAPPSVCRTIDRGFPEALPPARQRHNQSLEKARGFRELLQSVDASGHLMSRWHRRGEHRYVINYNRPEDHEDGRAPHGASGRWRSGIAVTFVDQMTHSKPKLETHAGAGTCRRRAAGDVPTSDLSPASTPVPDRSVKRASSGLRRRPPSPRDVAIVVKVARASGQVTVPGRGP